MSHSHSIWLPLQLFMDIRRGKSIETVTESIVLVRVPENSRRYKKTFLRDKCKAIVGNNRMGKTRDLFKKIKDTKGIFHAKMVSIKDRNGMDLTDAEDIKKRWQQYARELYKKDLHKPD